MLYRIALVLALTAGALVAQVGGAYGDEGLEGYESHVESVVPSMPKIKVLVLEGDDEIQLTNRTGQTVLISGYEKEPYLRFESDGVYENRRSPAAYLNADRFGTTAVPDDASPDAEPEWELATKGKTHAWHDHRIHWMSPVPPPSIDADESEEQHVFDWKIEATAGGKPFTVNGSLHYAAPAHEEESSNSLVYLVGAGVLAAAVAAAAFLGMRRFRRKPKPA